MRAHFYLLLVISIFGGYLIATDDSASTFGKVVIGLILAAALVLDYFATKSKKQDSPKLTSHEFAKMSAKITDEGGRSLQYMLHGNLIDIRVIPRHDDKGELLKDDKGNVLPAKYVYTMHTSQGKTVQGNQSGFFTIEEVIFDCLKQLNK